MNFFNLKKFNLIYYEIIMKINEVKFTSIKKRGESQKITKN